jgi:HSP20 family protein
MSLIKWEPFGEIDRFFEDFHTRGLRNIGRDMAVDLYEKGNNIVAEMNISGIDPEKVDITIEGDYLRVHGSREEEKEEEQKQFYSKEICRGSFERTIHIPENIDETQVEAEYTNGILKVIMPKTEKEEKEKIKIKVKE